MKKHLNPTIDTLLALTSQAVFGQPMDVKNLGRCLAGMYRTRQYSRMKIKAQ